MIIMKHQTAIPKKKRGPPPTGQGTPIMVRLQPVSLTNLDAWIATQDDRPTRPEAIRRILEAGLSAAQPEQQRPAAETARAAEMASEQIDKLADRSAPVEEQRARKRRLIQGPGDFREIRGDQPKRKR